MSVRRVVTWRVTPNGGFETTWVEIGKSTLTARGRSMGITPYPYWLDYRLVTVDDFMTQQLDVAIESAEGTRSLDLRQQDGRWSANGVGLADLDGAVDCDLGLCPLTNTMPILRFELNAKPGRHEFLMAWVAVPELTVTPSRQTYTHLSVETEGARVRYESGDFSSDLLVDADGLVVDYPQLASRIAG